MLIFFFYDVIQELYVVVIVYEVVFVLYGVLGIVMDFVKVSFILMFVCNLF